jgi:hypothetical protein
MRGSLRGEPPASTSICRVIVAMAIDRRCDVQRGRGSKGSKEGSGDAQRPWMACVLKVVQTGLFVIGW